MPHGTKGQLYAISIQSALRKHGPLDMPTLCYRTSLTDTQVRQGLHYSRRNTNSAVLANEIICAARLPGGGSYVYYLAASDAAAHSYEHHRRIVALGHIQSVICLEEKREAKWPSPSRAAAIKMMQMAHSLLTTAP